MSDAEKYVFEISNQEMEEMQISCQTILVLQNLPHYNLDYWHRMLDTIHVIKRVWISTQHRQLFVARVKEAMRVLPFRTKFRRSPIPTEETYTATVETGNYLFYMPLEVSEVEGMVKLTLAGFLFLVSKLLTELRIVVW